MSLRALTDRLSYATGYFPNLRQLPNPCKTLEFIELTQGVDLRPGQHLLDLGCGRGLQTQLLARRGPQCIGVDINTNTIDRARRELSHSRVRDRVTFVADEITAVGLEDGSLDHVFSFCVLEHIVELDAAMTVIRRALSPQGMIHATVDALTTITDPALLDTHQRKYHVVRYFRPEELREWLQKAGFEVLELRYILASARAAAQLTGELRGESPIWPRGQRRHGLAMLQRDEAAAGPNPDGGLMILFRARKA